MPLTVVTVEYGIMDIVEYRQRLADHRHNRLNAKIVMWDYDTDCFVELWYSTAHGSMHR